MPGFRVEQVKRRVTPPTIVAIGLLAACGPWQRVGTEPHPRAAATLPQLFDATAIYRAMGFMVGEAPLPFVASLHFFAGPAPDSTPGVLAMSLANHALSFRRADSGFVAGYHVELTFRADSDVVLRRAGDQTVRVRTFQETLRVDESVVYQQFVTVRPGIYTVRVVVRDRDGPAYAESQIRDTVQRFEAPGLGGLIPTYQSAGRSRLDALPDVVVNPRSTLPYGADSLRFYVEGYGLPAGTRLAARVLDPDSAVLWNATTTLGGGPIANAVFVVNPGDLPVGRAEFEIRALGTPARVAAPFLVTFSEQWAVANFDQMLDLLRYFDRPDLVAKLKAAARDQRAAAWREFYRASDPVPITPENEALNEYFRRVKSAATRFQEPPIPGWQTERGQVFIGLGEPDEITDATNQVANGVRFIQWTYTNLRVTLVFQDETGFGEFRLTPLSRSEFQRALARVRRDQ
jgi:GWxTD domain-containing protein